MHLRYLLQVAVFIALAILGFACGGSEEGSAPRDQSAPAEPVDSVTVVLDGQDSVSVFALLRAAHDVAFEHSAMGVFVSGIDSVVNGNGYYWLYAVNDTMGQTAADTRLTRDGDRVTWHFRRPGS